MEVADVRAAFPEAVLQDALGQVFPLFFIVRSFTKIPTLQFLKGRELLSKCRDYFFWRPIGAFWFWLSGSRHNESNYPPKTARAKSRPTGNYPCA
jgi:hypothetical protein